MKYKDLTLVVGLGFVGLTFGLTLSQHRRVLGVDNNSFLVQSLQSMKPTFHEPGLATLLAESVQSGRFTISSSMPSEPVDTLVITVGTPMGANMDDILSGVYSAVASATSCIGPDTLVILRSTVHIGTTVKLRKTLSEKLGFRPLVVFAPERTVEGKALVELLALPQIIGADDEESWNRARSLFEQMGVVKIVRTLGSAEAEFSKLIGNAYRDTFFGFANEIAFLASEYGLDAHDAIRAANEDYPRNHIAAPGITAGPCLEKDSLFLIDATEATGSIIKSARTVNEEQPLKFLKAVLGETLNQAPDRFKKLRALIVGLAFKGTPETSDIRGSYAPKIARWLKTFSGLPFDQVHGFDPLVDVEPNSLNLDKIVKDPSIEEYDLVIIHHKGTSVQGLIKKLDMRGPAPGSIIVDYWNSFSDSRPPIYVFGKSL